MNVEDLPETIEELQRGNTECPCPECEVTGSDIYIIDHFEFEHGMYNQKHAICRFIDSQEYLKYQQIDDGRFSILENKMDDRVRDAIERHPIHTVEMCEAYFGSIKETVDEAIAPPGSNGYSNRNDLFRAREKIKIRNTITEKSHKLYGSNWGQIRWDIYQRDNEQCRVTGKTDKHFSELDVHHIKPAREFVDDDGNVDYDAMNDPSNLITLSNEMHGRLEGKFTDCDPDEFVRRAREELSIDN